MNATLLADMQAERNLRRLVRRRPGVLASDHRVLPHGAQDSGPHRGRCDHPGVAREPDPRRGLRVRPGYRRRGGTRRRANSSGPSSTSIPDGGLDPLREAGVRPTPQSGTADGGKRRRTEYDEPMRRSHALAAALFGLALAIPRADARPGEPPVAPPPAAPAIHPAAIGATTRAPTTEEIDAYGLGPVKVRVRGRVLETVEEGGPAAKAGLVVVRCARGAR